MERGIKASLERRFLKFEKRFSPKSAEERESYLNIKVKLSDPKSSEFSQVIQDTRLIVDSIFPNKLKRENFLDMAPIDPKMFGNFRRQAIFSDHNIAHLTIVAALSALDIAVQNPTSTDIPHLQKRAWIAGALHDIRRHTDVLGSLVVPIHGWTSAFFSTRIIHLMKRMGVGTEILNSKNDTRHIKRAIRHHDLDLLPKTDPNREELNSLITADRAAIGRLFESKKLLVRLSAGRLAAKRMRAHPDRAKNVSQEYMDKLINIAGTADILTRNKIELIKKSQGTVSAMDEYNATIETLTELGIFAPVEVEEVAQFQEAVVS